MSAFEWNKIIGAVLTTLLVIKVVDIAGHASVHTETPAKNAYPVAGASAAAPAATKVAKKAGPEIPPIGPLLAKASVDAGKAAARKCAICHNFEKGAGPKIGPDLWNVIGRKMGEGSFNFSDAMKKKGATIDYETLNHFLYDPRKFVPGTKMAFAGIKNDTERASVILYLRSLSDNPAPLP